MSKRQMVLQHMSFMTLNMFTAVWLVSSLSKYMDFVILPAVLSNCSFEHEDSNFRKSILSHRDQWPFLPLVDMYTIFYYHLPED